MKKETVYILIEFEPDDLYNFNYHRQTYLTNLNYKVFDKLTSMYGNKIKTARVIDYIKLPPLHPSSNGGFNVRVELQLKEEDDWYRECVMYNFL